MHIQDITQIKSEDELLKRSKWLEGKLLVDIYKEIIHSDADSRVIGKANVGYVIEKGFFNIKPNSGSNPDIPHLGVEIKTIPLKYNATKTKLCVKEPTSLNIINYSQEVNNTSLLQSSLYKKNKTVLFIAYIHDKDVPRSNYIIKYVFLWKMDEGVISELEPDYLKIIDKIKAGKAHEIHQPEHEYLTICPKHGGTFRDPLDSKSKTKQPFSDIPAEVRAFRLKNRYMNKVICDKMGLKLDKGYWSA